MMIKWLFTHIYHLWILLSIASPLNAAIITVDTSTDELNTPTGPNTSLREAIRDATTGDTINFAPSLNGAVIFLLSGEYLIDKNLTIDASALGNGLTLYGAGDRIARIYGSLATIKNITFRNGTASNGGALHISNGSTVNMNQCRIVANKAHGTGGITGLGGGIYCDSSALIIINSTIEQNSTTTDVGADLAGGGISMSGGNTTSLTLIGTTVQNNSTPMRGGGIHSTSTGTMTIIDSTISGNNAASGGGIDLTSGTLTLSGSTVSSNVGSSNGGGIYITSATVDLIKSTFANNISTAEGGAIDLNNSAIVTIESCTIAENTSQNGGGVHNNNSTLSLVNSIVAANGASYGKDIYFQSGTLTRSGVSIVGSNDQCDTPFPAGNPNVNGDIVGTIIARIEPGLSPLGYYGGPTMTMHPLTNSPAYNAGGSTSLSTDQRGYPRVVGASLDTGAVEVSTTLLVTTAIDENDGGLGLGVGNSLRECIQAATSPGSLISFAQVLDGNTLTITNGAIPVSAQTVLIDASGLSNGITIDGDSTYGIFNCSSSANLSINSLTITKAGARAITSESGSSLSLSNCAFTANLSGCLDLELSKASIRYCDFTDNTLNTVSSGGGAAVFALTSDVVIDQSSFVGNSTVSTGGPLGGAIRSAVSTLHVSRCNFSNNSALGSSAGKGGAIYLSHLLGPALSYSSITNSTFKGNQSALGGAIELGNIIGSIELSHLTITGNVSDLGGGINLKSAGTDGKLLLNHCIIATNLSPINADINYDPSGGGSNPIVVSGPNLIGDNSSVASIFPAGALVGTMATPLDPMLGSHSNHGGFTNSIPLLPGSPAIDAGSVIFPALQNDQRGFSRMIGTAPDLGAYENGHIVGYSTWVEEKIASGLDADFAGDSEFDTNRNGVEYATGRHPAVTEDAAILHLTRVAKAGGGYEMHITFAYEPDAPDIKYILQRNTTLDAFGARYRFTPSTGIEQLHPSGNVTATYDEINKTITVVDDGIGDGPRYFWRLMIEELPTSP